METNESFTNTQKTQEKNKKPHGVTANALRGMSSSGNVNVDSTGNVVDNTDLKVPEEINLKELLHRFSIKTATIADLFSGSDYYLLQRNHIVSGNKEDPYLELIVEVYDKHPLSIENIVLMSLKATISSDNTAHVETLETGEFEIAPVLEAVGNMPNVDRVFYDFKKAAKNGLLKGKMDARNEELKSMYAPKKKASKKKA